MTKKSSEAQISRDPTPANDVKSKNKKLKSLEVTGG